MSLREQMPTAAGWVDELREAFGVEVVDAAIANGMRQAKLHAAILAAPNGSAEQRELAVQLKASFARGGFCASEGGQVVGIKRNTPGVWVSGKNWAVDQSVDILKKGRKK